MAREPQNEASSFAMRLDRLEAIVVRMYDLVGNHWVHGQLLAPMREEINKLRADASV